MPRLAIRSEPGRTVDIEIELRLGAGDKLDARVELVSNKGRLDLPGKFSVFATETFFFFGFGLDFDTSGASSEIDGSTVATDVGSVIALTVAVASTSWLCSRFKS